MTLRHDVLEVRMTRLTLDDVYEHISGVCFKTGPPGQVGAETEWFVVDRQGPDRHLGRGPGAGGSPSGLWWPGRRRTGTWRSAGRVRRWRPRPRRPPAAASPTNRAVSSS